MVQVKLDKQKSGHREIFSVLPRIINEKSSALTSVVRGGRRSVAVLVDLNDVIGRALQTKAQCATTRMSKAEVLRKDQLEISLHEEKRLIENGILKEDNPLDNSENFRRLCEACRRGDLKICQEMITEGTNINAKDQFDYTPLILASLCGHYEVVQLLLEAGALCERDTFQGERCLYNALNDRIRNLLLSYDYSKSTDPLQPLAFHISSLLARDHPQTADIAVSTVDEVFHLHKFVLSARSPYFRQKLAAAPETTTWRLGSVPPQSFAIAIKYLYLAELPRDLGGGPGTGFTDSEILAGVDKISKHLEIQSLSQLILDGTDRRLARQRRSDEVEKGRDQLDSWFQQNVIKHKVVTDTSKADDVKWDRDNGIFADVLLRADEDEDEEYAYDGGPVPLDDGGLSNPTSNRLGIPIGPAAAASRSPSRTRKSRRSVLFPCHKAMLIRSEFFLNMFNSSFREAQITPHLQIISIDCSPIVLEIVLTFHYTERADFPLDLAVDVLFAADLLFLEKLKAKAAVVISTLGNGTATAMPSLENPNEDEYLDIYEILRAAWLTRVQRLEEFAARYMAYRLEAYIDEPEFAELVKESASRISARQETDSIELIDDIRHYLSERFRLRFEDSGLEDVMDEDQAIAEAKRENLQQEQGRKDANAAAAGLPNWGSTHGGASPPEDEGVDMRPAEAAAAAAAAPATAGEALLQTGEVRTLDGEIAGDEFAADAINYQILLGKIDKLLEKLRLDA